MNIDPPDESALVELARQIAAQPDAEWPLAALAARFGLSAPAFQRRFVACIGVSPMRLQEAARMGRLKQALRAGARVTDAILEAGFGSTSRVYGEAQRDLGMTLSAYRRGAAGEHIAWATRHTELGWLLMAATERGVCFAQFGDDPDALLALLRQEFPHAALERSAADAGGAAARALDAWIEALQAWLQDGGPRPELPLDLRGTAFQVRVWRFLQGLGEGRTLSYSALAAAIGQPRAVRAAASACAANRIAVLVPCHRVLRGDGGLGGYRWGLERKRALLAREGAG